MKKKSLRLPKPFFYDTVIVHISEIKEIDKYDRNKIPSFWTFF